MAKDKLEEIKVTAKKIKRPKKKLLTEAQHQRLTGSKGEKWRARAKTAGRAGLGVRPFGFSPARYGAQKLNEVADLVDKYENWVHKDPDYHRKNPISKKQGRK